MFGEVFGNGGRQGFPAGLREQLGAAIGVMLVGGPGGPGGINPLITGDELSYHDGDQILLPNGMLPGRARQILDRMEEEQETETQFDKKFLYRPDDGAYATAQVIKKRYGMHIGEKIDMGFFGGIKPPETRTIKIGFDESVQVPWGLISIPTLPGLEMMLCDRHPDRDYGLVFELHVTAPRKYKKEIEEFFADVEQYLKEHSIYRGKALRGADRLEFLDLSEFDPDKIVFADSVTNILKGTVWSVIRHTQTLRDEGVSRKKAVLLYGPYGTGKTSAGQLTAKIAGENGWTFLSAGPDDDIEDVLQTARLYMPAVVFVEDIDTQASSGEDDEASELLDAFDGITAKGGELVIMMTTNHFERIHKGMLRPGRLDGVVEVNGLDRHGVERLIKAVVKPGKLAIDIDYDVVHKAMDGFFPAFVRGALDRAVTFAIDRLNGQGNYVLNTEDLVGAADSLRPQLEALHAAAEGERIPTLDATLKGAFLDMARQAVHGTHVEGSALTLSVPALNGNGH